MHQLGARAGEERLGRVHREEEGRDEEAGEEVTRGQGAESWTARKRRKQRVAMCRAVGRGRQNWSRAAGNNIREQTKG